MFTLDIRNVPKNDVNTAIVKADRCPLVIWFMKSCFDDSRTKITKAIYCYLILN